MNKQQYAQSVLEQMEAHASTIFGECTTRHADKRGTDPEAMWTAEMRRELEKSATQVYTLWLERTGLAEMGYVAEIRTCEEFGQFQLNVYLHKIIVN